MYDDFMQDYPELGPVNFELLQGEAIFPYVTLRPYMSAKYGRAQYLSSRPPSSTISPMAGFRNQSINMRNYFDTFVERQWYLSSASPMATVQNHYLSRNERRAFGYALRRRYLHHKQPRKKHRHPYTFRRKKRHQ